MIGGIEIVCISLKPSFIQVINCKVSWNISRTQWVLFYWAFTLNWWVLYIISIEYIVGYIVLQTQTLELVILTEYLASAVIVVSSYPFLGTSPRTSISFFNCQHALTNYCLHIILPTHTTTYTTDHLVTKMLSVYASNL